MSIMKRKVFYTDSFIIILLFFGVVYGMINISKRGKQRGGIGYENENSCSKSGRKYYGFCHG